MHVKRFQIISIHRIREHGFIGRGVVQVMPIKKGRNVALVEFVRLVKIVAPADSSDLYEELDVEPVLEPVEQHAEETEEQPCGEKRRRTSAKCGSARSATLASG